MRHFIPGVALSVAVLFGGALSSLPAAAEMNRLDDGDLSDISGQGGIYLSGDISINADGGPIQNTYFGSCSDADKRCGARIAYRLKQDGGWMVLDDIRGKFSFEGLTLRVRTTRYSSSWQQAAPHAQLIRGSSKRIFSRSKCRVMLSWRAACWSFPPGIPEGA